MDTHSSSGVTAPRLPLPATVLLVAHARKKIGADAFTRSSLGIRRLDRISLKHGDQIVTEKVFRVSAQAANLRCVTRPTTPVVFVPRYVLKDLGVSSGSSVLAAPASFSFPRAVPPPLPLALPEGVKADRTTPGLTPGTVADRAWIAFKIAASSVNISMGITLADLRLRDRSLPKDLSGAMKKLCGLGLILPGDMRGHYFLACPSTPTKKAQYASPYREGSNLHKVDVAARACSPDFTSAVLVKKTGLFECQVNDMLSAWVRSGRLTKTSTKPATYSFI